MKWLTARLAAAAMLAIGLAACGGGEQPAAPAPAANNQAQPGQNTYAGGPVQGGFPGATAPGGGQPGPGFPQTPGAPSGYGQSPGGPGGGFSAPNSGGVPGGPQMPNVVPAVQQAAQTAEQICRNGAQQACQAQQWFTQMASGLSNDFNACQGGNQQACQSYMQHAQQAYAGMQQFMAQTGGMQGGPGMPGGGGGMGGYGGQ